jgi:hypothetical protein
VGVGELIGPVSLSIQESLEASGEQADIKRLIVNKQIIKRFIQPQFNRPIFQLMA